MNGIPPLPSDHQLVEATRSGDDAAWRELMERHERSIRSVLRQRRRRGRPDVAQALDQFRTMLGEELPAEGREAIRAFRPRAIAAVTGGSYGPASVDSAVDRIDDDNRLLAAAFARLPEPWQTVLWHTHVEHLTAAEVSPLVGRSANEVVALVSTADRGLIDAYLQEYLQAGEFDADSVALIALLDGYIRSSLSANEQRLVEAHLGSGVVGGVDPSTGVRRQGAEESRRLIDVALSLGTVLPPAIAPAITGTSVEAQRAALGTVTRSFGSAAMRAERSERVRRAIVIGSIIAVILVLVGVAVVRQPFDNDDPPSISTVEPTVPPTTPSEPQPSQSSPSSEIDQRD